MRILLLFIFLISCSTKVQPPRGTDYYLLAFYITTKSQRPVIVKNCEPHSLKKGRLLLKSVVADFTGEGLYCTQKGTYQSYICNNTFKTARAVLVQGRKECLEIPDDTAIKERRML